MTIQGYSQSKRNVITMEHPPIQVDGSNRENGRRYNVERLYVDGDRLCGIVSERTIGIRLLVKGSSFDAKPKGK